MKAFILIAAALAAGPSPDVDTAEIVRHGDMVQVIDNGIQGDADALRVEALAPPKDDLDKWHISVLFKSDEQASVNLKKAWESGDPELTAWANPHDVSNSYAHLNFYDAKDDSQRFRFEGLQINGYPTVFVQPPRTKRYGDPGTIVMQRTGFDGDTAALARAMRDAIGRYVDRFSDGHQQAGDVSAGAPSWTPPPKAQPAIVGPGTTTVDQVVPPPTLLSPKTWPTWAWMAVAGLGVVLLFKGRQIFAFLTATHQRNQEQYFKRMAAVLQAQKPQDG